MQIYLHIAFGGIGSIQQRFISSPFNWKTALKNFKKQFIDCRSELRKRIGCVRRFLSVCAYYVVWLVDVKAAVLHVYFFQQLYDRKELVDLKSLKIIQSLD